MSVRRFVREYGGVVWTDHALERLESRGIDQSDAVAVMRKPERTFPGKKDGSIKFIRTIDGRRINVVAMLDERKKWVVMSVWVRGEEDQWGFPERYVYQLVGWGVGMVQAGLVTLVRGVKRKIDKREKR